jgi:hypothetical protein
VRLRLGGRGAGQLYDQQQQLRVVEGCTGNMATANNIAWSLQHNPSPWSPLLSPCTPLPFPPPLLPTLFHLLTCSSTLCPPPSLAPRPLPSAHLQLDAGGDEEGHPNHRQPRPPQLTVSPAGGPGGGIVPRQGRLLPLWQRPSVWVNLYAGCMYVGGLGGGGSSLLPGWSRNCVQLGVFLLHRTGTSMQSLHACRQMRQPHTQLQLQANGIWQVCLQVTGNMTPNDVVGRRKGRSRTKSFRIMSLVTCRALVDVTCRPPPTLPRYKRWAERPATVGMHISRRHG